MITMCNVISKHFNVIWVFLKHNLKIICRKSTISVYFRTFFITKNLSFWKQSHPVRGRGFTKKQRWHNFFKILNFIYIYILVMSLRVWIPAWWAKHTSRTPPWACDTSLEASRQKKSIREKKSRFARAARPQRAKTRSAHYISHFKTTV